MSATEAMVTAWGQLALASDRANTLELVLKNGVDACAHADFSGRRLTYLETLHDLTHAPAQIVEVYAGITTSGDFDTKLALRTSAPVRVLILALADLVNGGTNTYYWSDQVVANVDTLYQSPAFTGLIDSWHYTLNEFTFALTGTEGAEERTIPEQVVTAALWPGAPYESWGRPYPEVWGTHGAALDANKIGDGLGAVPAVLVNRAPLTYVVAGHELTSMGDAVSGTIAVWTRAPGITRFLGYIEGCTIARGRWNLAYVDVGTGELRAYAWDPDAGTFAQVGNALAITGITTATALAVLNGRDVAFLDGGNKSLRLYRFDGVDWAKLGSGKTITSCGTPALAAMNGTDVALIDDANDKLRLYRWGGTSWSLVGSGLAIGSVGPPALSRLNATDVAFVDGANDKLRTYRWDENTGTWSLAHTGLAIATVTKPALATLNETDVAFYDATNQELRLYRRDGSDVWALVGSGLSITVGTGITGLASINATDVAWLNGAKDKLSTYRWTEATTSWALVGTEFSLACTGPALAAFATPVPGPATVTLPAQFIPEVFIPGIAAGAYFANTADIPSGKDWRDSSTEAELAPGEILELLFGDSVGTGTEIFRVWILSSLASSDLRGRWCGPQATVTGHTTTTVEVDGVEAWSPAGFVQLSTGVFTYTAITQVDASHWNLAVTSNPGSPSGAATEVGAWQTFTAATLEVTDQREWTGTNFTFLEIEVENTSGVTTHTVSFVGFRVQFAAEPHPEIFVPCVGVPVENPNTGVWSGEMPSNPALWMIDFHQRLLQIDSDRIGASMAALVAAMVPWKLAVLLTEQMRSGELVQRILDQTPLYLWRDGSNVIQLGMFATGEAADYTLVAADDIIDGEGDGFHVTHTDPEDIITRVFVNFAPPRFRDGFSAQYRITEDDSLPEDSAREKLARLSQAANRVVNTLVLDAPDITDAGAALLLARHKFDLHSVRRSLLDFAVPAQVAVAPGDIIAVTHDLIPTGDLFHVRSIARAGLDLHVSALFSHVGVSWTTAALVGSGLSIATVGAPALARLSDTAVAMLDVTNASLRYYAFDEDAGTWSLQGSGLAIATLGTPALTALNETDVVMLDGTNDKLRLYRWGGSSWSLVGSGLAISGVGAPALAAINSTDVAMIDDANDKLRLYRHDGAGGFALVGTEKGITGVGPPALAKLNATDIAYLDDSIEKLRVYRWDEDSGTWTQIGNGYTMAALVTPAIAALSDTDVVVTDATNHVLQIYRFSGAAWSPTGTPFDLTSIGAPALAGLTGTDFAFLDATNDALRMYRWAFELST